MMNRINNILIGVLWLLAVTLGTTFWFNTMFGFNIFSGSHWQHLAYMQATGQTVKPLFYISLIVAILIAVFGLYKLLHPRFRQITLPIIDRGQQPRGEILTETHQTVNIQPAPLQTSPQPDAKDQSTIATTPSAVRPPRLNIPTVTRTEPAPRVPLTGTPQPRINTEKEYAEIRDIFESAGYLYKGAPKIKNVPIAIVAIGTGEVLWIGAVGVKSTDMQRAVQTLSGVFSDTLDDIEIHIHAFILGSPDSADAPSDILQFATVDDLRKYIAEKPNTPPSMDEVENFDAYSGYIGTVMDYIGKI